jgi:hypothetical protein
MPADGFPGRHEADDPGDAKPDEQHRRIVNRTDRSAMGIEPAETRDRAEYYEAVRAAVLPLSNLDADGPSADTQRPASAWKEVPAAQCAYRPAPDSLSLPPERADHILDGDPWGGGHRHGTGRPAKTEFPADWDDERILGRIMDVARAPDVQPVMQPNRRWRVRGERDGVGITVILHPDGRIWAAWPEEGSPGVIRNPREGKR